MMDIPNFTRWPMPSIAEWINENCSGLHAECERSWSSTDSKIPGTRLRRIGKGRDGYKLTVHRAGVALFTHDSSQTYRYNGEISDKLRNVLR